MQEASIVVLAAGMGSRYGGIKQMATIGPNDEWLLDYSLYDAWRAGFNHVIFIIRPELEAGFETAIGQRIRAYMKVDYAYQTNTELVPESLNLAERKKPLGTGHALLCARHLINGPFAVINADDYYGPRAYQLLYSQLVGSADNTSGAMVAYALKETLSDYGSVARGLCTIDEGARLVLVKERTGLQRVAAHIQDEYGEAIGEDTWVSMNIWALPQHFLTYLEQQFLSFVKFELQYNPKTAEFYLPKTINAAIENRALNIAVFLSSDKWTGMTYVEDFPKTKQIVQDLQENGHYPAQLWSQTIDFSDLMASFGFTAVNRVEPITRGHINATYLVTAACNEHVSRLILQRINTQVFQTPEKLMANIEVVTSYIKAQGLKTLELLYTKDGSNLYRDGQGHCWRLYHYVEDSQVPTEQAEPKELFAAGYAFGRFQYALKDFEASVLNAVIPDFHNTPKRFQQLEQAIALNPLGRCAGAADEIAFTQSMVPHLDYILRGMESGELPLRVTHNDTKVNNVLLDSETGEGLCVIDLDTVMPGSLLYDYGDGIRSTVTGRPEDEQDLQTVHVNKERFEAFTSGFLKGTGNMLTESELNGLLYGAILMTHECGMRFLTDYILGDVYFKIDYPDQNLVRARSQFQLVKRLLAEKDALESCILDIYRGGRGHEQG